jgi:hypothetical protein
VKEEDEQELFRRLNRIDRRVKYVGGTVNACAALAIGYFIYTRAMSDYGLSSNWAWWAGAAAWLVVTVFCGSALNRD